MPEQILHLNYSDSDSIHLFVDLAGVGIGGDIWPAATQFCHLITAHTYAPYFHHIFTHKRIVELGSGTGLVSICIDKYYSPSEILVSDLSTHIELIHRNLLLNQTKVCTAEPIDWLLEANLPKNDKYDVIVAFEWYRFLRFIFVHVFICKLHCVNFCMCV